MKKATRRHAAALLLVAASFGCSHAPARQVGSIETAPAQEIPSVFRQFYRGFIDQDLVAVRAALPYDSISLEKSGGMTAPGGWFKLVLMKNGSATLWSDGAGSFGRAGDFVGNVDIFDFGKVSHLINHVGFDRFAPRYEARLTDLHTMTVTVTTAGRTISVSDYGGAGPVDLWSIQQSLEAVGHRIFWKPK